MRWFPVVVFTVIGCSDVSVEGDVDGREVSGGRSAVFDEFELEIPFVGDFEYTNVIVSDARDLCEVLNALSDAEDLADGECPALCTGYLKVLEDFRLDPETFWTLTLSANTSEGSNGDFAFDDIAEPGEFNGSFAFIDAGALTDQASCESACEEGDLLSSDTINVDGGSFTLDVIEAEELPGEFALTFDEGGALDGSFEAEACSLEDL